MSDPTTQLFEPRSLWDVVSLSTSQNDPSYGTFVRTNLQNGGNYAMQVTRLVFCPVGYALRSQQGVVGTVNFRFENSMAILQRAQIRVNVPFRKHLSRVLTPMISFRPRPTWTPRPLNSATIASSLYGITRLEFDKTLDLPRLGTIELGISAVPYPQITNDMWATDPQDVTVSMIFQEDGGQMNASARFRDREVLAGIHPTRFTLFGPTLPNFFGKTSPITNVQQWPPAGTFTGREFDQENATRSGSSRVDAISVHLDQISFDTTIGAQDANNGVGTSAVAAPLSTQVGCRVRTIAGGSGEYWWRTGAPLALVMDTITPALVFPLDEPITIPPGDTIDVEVAYPAAGSASAHNQFLGISANGYAIVEG